jgi:hypothetical protein
MTPQEKEYLGYGIAGLGLIGLYALSKRSGSSGLGQAYNAQIVLEGTSQQVTNVQPQANIELQVSGVTSADYVETNLDITGNLSSSWTPSYTTPALIGESAVQPNLPPIIWQKVGVAPSSPGQYTVLVAINGTIVLSLPLTVSSSGSAAVVGGYGSFGFPIITPAQTAASAAIAAGQLAQPSPSAPSVPSAPAPSTSTPTSSASTVVTTPSTNGTALSTTSTASLSDLSSLLTGTVYGIPIWLLLGGGALAVYLMSSRK